MFAVSASNLVSEEKRCNVFYKKEASSSENLISCMSIRKTISFCVYA